MLDHGMTLNGHSINGSHPKSRGLSLPDFVPRELNVVPSLFANGDASDTGRRHCTWLIDISRK